MSPIEGWGRMELLKTVRGPADLAGMTGGELSRLADEIRGFLVEKVSGTGGHLGPNLGVVELTIALHRVFDSAKDRIVWDTGHQTYVHKMLTGRTAGFDRLRQRGGLSGYPSAAESAHDLVENSHASTALSYADGLAKGFRLRGLDDCSVVAVIGDGALTGGMAWEALNNLSDAPDRQVIVVLNDNGRSYAPTIGGLAHHLAQLRTSTAEHNMFESLGMTYLGPVDGHDVAAVESALRQAAATCGPVVVHCVTEKGRGYVHAVNDDADRFHAVRVIDPATGKPLRAASGPSWTSVFGEEITRLGEEREDIVAITAAMLEPTGLGAFARKFPQRTFDVGIAEQHAVTSAAGLAKAGMRPVVALYATFVNRAFDQVLMDVALHSCPVVFVLDRAGVTGDDGPSHNGMWDLSLLNVVPTLRIAAPRDAATLRRALGEALDVDDRPSAVRFPKGQVGADVPAVEVWSGVDVLSVGATDDVLLVSVGALSQLCLEVAGRLEAQGIGVTVVDPRWVKPVSADLLGLTSRYRTVVVVEDNLEVGGAGALLAHRVRESGGDVPVLVFGVPQGFPEQGSRAEVLADAGLTATGVARTIVERMVATAPWAAERQFDMSDTR